MEQKILVINETKRDKILLKPKVYDQENLCGIPLTFVKVIDKSWPTFGHFSVHEWKLTKFRQYLTAFPSHFNNIFLKSLWLLQNLARNCIILQLLMRFHKTNNISQNFSGVTLGFREVSKYFVDFWYFRKMTPKFQFLLNRFEIYKFCTFQWWK